MARNRKQLVLGLLAAAAVAALVGREAWRMVATRPAITGRSPSDAFGIDRADTPAPPIDLAALDGSRFTLASARGQVVFLNFWATWCPPCRDEMPSMLRLGRALSERYPERFEMVAVSVDEGWDPVKEYLGAPPFSGSTPGVTVALDAAAETARAYYCAARGFCPDMKFPETYIVDRTGRLVAYIVGPRNWDDPAALAFLESLLR